MSWTELDTNLPLSQPLKKHINVAFPDVDWKSQQSVFGWAALQYQAWARGTIEVYAEAKQTIALYSEQVLEFWLDEEPFFGGDFYGLRRSPLVLHLDPGPHRLDIRLIRDLRAMGGNYNERGPEIDIDLEIKLCTEPLLAVTKMLLPDYVDDAVAGSLGSISLQNTETRGISITGIQSANVSFSAKSR